MIKIKPDKRTQEAMKAIVKMMIKNNKSYAGEKGFHAFYNYELKCLAEIRNVQDTN